ncbi:Predicted arabinose efflux permease, MFS family [Saccharopolyspora antimicrobica]|uniref:MFS family arabinose efflux permease n=1 Tax=Saccharopolyspora antimicrobica TaxID=455193 RepID=A0A1I4X8X3_9PSEU|nr:aromatic acid/H+ symport family MFS transporter [Saccharopolyspora antimicrobica]RKT84380.1 putative MFS family arabinose efflux permease [Saccharopolyspora antimicrobica]SFN22195.1 Predicted arabinose efflux permease, MFS family [Saccharopolyspora antimicrobica]
MSGRGSAGRSGWVLPLCWTAVLLDGFDLVVLGSVLPVLLEGQQWGLTAAGASLVSTAGLVGMTIGALAIGTITDVIGRRKALIFAVVSFSLFTALCAVAPSVFVFGLLRFLAGLGLGGCLPTAIALVTEHARAGRSGSATTTIMTGYHVGAVLTALLGIAVLPNLGWRAMFLIGAAPALVLVPLMLRYLPESESFQQVKAERGASGGADAVASLFRGGFARATIAFWITSFMGLLLVYGLNTWLPQIMKSAGYPLDAALGLLLTLNIGAVIGLLIAGAVADRVGPRSSTIGWFAASAVFLAALSIKLPGIGVYVAVLVAGCFVFSSQVLVYAYIGRVYPAANRATGLGWSAGIGRIGAICGPLLGGAMLTAGIAYPWGFYAFAVVGALGAVGAALVRRPGVAQSPERAAERVEQ